MTEKAKSLVTKLAEVMAAVERIPKNGFNEHFKYHYATEADVADGVRRLLAERNLVMYPDVKSMEFRGGDKFCVLDVAWTIRDGDSDAAITFHVPGMGQDSNDKGPYKAMTGSQKYALMKLLHIPTGDDPEKDGVAAPAKKERAKAGRQPGETPEEYAGHKPAEAPSVTLSFGSAKGQTVRETPTKDLLWYQKALSENVADPKKAKWRAGNQTTLDAVTAELDRRKEIDEPPFEHEPPKAPVSEPRGVETLSLPDPDATAEERKALLLKARKLSEALKLTRDEKYTAWVTYCATATEHNVDCAALTDLVKWLETRCQQKGVAA